MKALTDSEIYVRREAARALVDIKDPRSVQGLVHALTDGDSDVRNLSAWALAEIGLPAIEGLIGGLTSRFRYSGSGPEGEAADVLVRIGLPASRLLIAALKSEEPLVRLRVAWVLVKIDPSGALPPPELDLAEIAGAYSFFIRRGEATTEDALIQALKAWGSIEMAEDYLNCGNRALEKAAVSWAEGHFYHISVRPGRGGVQWGGQR